MNRFCLTAAVIAISFTAYAQNPTLINAEEVINKGKELYDSGKYKESIAQYLAIPKRDTAYLYMLSELAMSYIANEEFDKALESCEEGLKKPSPYRAHFMRSQAIATDRKGDYEKAVTLFKKAIESYPADVILVYNLGITHYNNKAHAQAVDCFFKVLSINPFHPGSHLNLGRIAANEGRKTHAMFSLGMYLGINNSDNERLVFLEKILSNQFPEEGSLKATHANAFDKLDQIIRAKIAMDKNYKSKIDIDAAIVRQYQLFFDQLETGSKTNDDPWANYYLPIYKTLKEKEMIEPFIFFMLKSSSIELVKKWHQKNQKKLEAFFDVTNAALKKKREMITLRDLGFENPVQAWYFNNNRIEAIGNEDAQGKRQGKWVYLKQNFERSAEGNYSSDGKKVGTWKYYQSDGSISSVENYDNGEVHVYKDGVIAQHFFLKNDKIQGKAELYDACGIVSETLLYDQGRRHGAGKALYASGVLKSTYTYDSNKVVDVFTNYFESGKIKNTMIYKDDKLAGKYIEHYANGKLKSVGNYADDLLTGPWKYYHANGRLESAGNYKEGQPVGDWTFHNERGQLIEKRNYDNEGKYNGENTVYYNGKVQYINTYKDDVLVGVQYLDTEGKQLGKFGDANGTFITKQYYPTGQLAADGAFKKGKMDGRWTYYYPHGAKHSEYFYQDGQVQGEATEYHKSGGKKYIFHYKDGKFDGKFEEFYPHNQLKQVGFFSNGERQQQWFSYYPNGVVELDYYYLNGSLTGLCLDYSTTGKLTSATDYTDNRVLNYATYNAQGVTTTQRREQANIVTFETKYNSGKPQTIAETRCGEYTKITKWFPNGSVFYTYAFRNGSKEGPYQYNSVTGKALLTGTFIDGQEEGSWKGHFDNGTLDYEGFYLSGKHDSTWIYYFPNGKISSVAEFRNGERDGITKNYSPDGSPLLEKLYIEGHLVAYRPLKSAQTPEDWKPLSSNTSIVITYDNGKKAYEETFKDGVLTGVKRLYYQNGNLFSEFNYVLGDYHGDFSIYAPSGKPLEKGTYKFDELDGTVEKYNEDGSLLLKEQYVMGSLNGKTTLYDKGQKKLEFDFFGGLPYDSSYSNK